MEERTVVQITVDNNDSIRTSIDLTDLEENAVRYIHSILDEMRCQALAALANFKEQREDHLLPPDEL